MMANPDLQTQDQADTAEQGAESSVMPEYRTPGKILREAREKQQLNRARVGQGLGLTETAVKNLESNKFELFPGSVYVRGYLKNYAKLLNLSEDELISVYDKYCFDHELDTGKSSMDAMTETVHKNSTQKFVLATFVLIALVTIILLVIGNIA